MRRTYRSKKESNNAFDHRDVLLMDEKSSAFDAFYIHNIKQTKRELSSVGSSNHFGVASNKVRKRKYVKRIIKEVEPKPLRETMSPSAYLTPDKSIRVNKVLDPFDMLLISSPACEVAPKVVVSSAKEEKSTNKICKKYNRKRLPRKKFHYSSDSSSTESDKENYNDDPTNITDIRTHELVIERVPSNSPKDFDESINKIVNNISLIKTLKQKTVDSYNLNNSRLSKFHSPILPKSPLCSTPYREKYRGVSIYKFSPISMKELENSPATIEESGESDKSIILVNKTTTKVSQKGKPPLDNHANSTTKKTNSLKNDITKTDISIIQTITDYKNDEEQNNVSETKSELSFFQITDAEPFLGFSNVAKECISENTLLKCIEDRLRTDEVHNDDDNKVIGIENDEECYSESSNSIVSIKCNSSNSDRSSIESSDKESIYDTCSDQSLDCKEPVVSIERMNDSLFLKYYEKMIEAQIDTDSEGGSETENGAENDNKSITDDLDKNGDAKCRPNVIIITDSSTTDDVMSNGEDEEEQCVSFVTTRKRNDTTADSRFSFDNSFISSSTDCDKTVLSNKVDMDKSHLVEIEQTNNNVSPFSVRNSVSSMFSTQQNYNEFSPDGDRFSMVTFRKSTRNTKSDLTPQRLDANASEVTLMEDHEPSNVTVVENSLEISTNDMNKVKAEINRDSILLETSCVDTESKLNIVLQPGKKWERSLSIYRRMTAMSDLEQSILEDECSGKKGRKYRQSVISTMEMQEQRDSLYNDSIFCRRSTLFTKPGRPTIRFVKDSNSSRLSLNVSANTAVEDLKGFLNEECDDTVIELSKLSIADPEHEVSILDKFHESERVLTAKDYVLRRCNQTEPLLFDECYPETVLKNCHKIGEGVYGEVFLWRARDGRARVMKIVPIAGSVKVNGEDQKDFHEIISEIVIAMELSALRAPIADIERQLDEGKELQATQLHDIQNATDIFNEVLAVRCVYGVYPSRLLDLWELYDECKGSENDSPATLPASQRYIVLELANAGQDLESYQFASAQQAHALFQQLAFGLAVAEEAFQFEHRDLHWGNVLIAPTEQKYATFVVRGRTFRTPRHGVAATIIDYSLSRVTVPLSAGVAPAQADLYNDLAHDDQLFDAVGDYQFQVYRLMRDKLGNDWKNFEPYTNILWLHYTVDKMITALRYKRTNTKIHKHYIEKLRAIKESILSYGSCTQYVLTDIQI